MEIRSPKTESEWEGYYVLRYKVLREPLGQPKGSERNDGDEIGQHFALYDGGKLRAIARLDIHQNGISQVRFVAVDNSIHGKGFGRKIMEATEQASIEKGNTKMILHARENAVEFYKKLGYIIVEKSYLLFDQIQHYLMEKTY